MDGFVLSMFFVCIFVCISFAVIYVYDLNDKSEITKTLTDNDRIFLKEYFNNQTFKNSMDIKYIEKITESYQNILNNLVSKIDTLQKELDSYKNTST